MFDEDVATKKYKLGFISKFEGNYLGKSGGGGGK